MSFCARTGRAWSFGHQEMSSPNPAETLSRPGASPGPGSLEAATGDLSGTLNRSLVSLVQPGQSLCITGPGIMRKAGRAVANDHPAHAIARALAGYAGELSAYLSDDFPWKLTSADHKELLPQLEAAARKIAGCAGSIADSAGTGTKLWEILGEGADHVERGTMSFDSAMPLIAAAARAEEDRERSRIALAAEKAWEAGVRDARTGEVALTHNGRNVTWTIPESYELAASLGIRLLPGGEPEPADEEMMFEAGACYWDSYCEAAEQADGAAGIPGKYLAGQRVTTAAGRGGVLTGETGHGRRPRVLFDDGTESTVPRAAVTRPLVLEMDTLADAVEAWDRSPGVQYGDVFLLPDGSARVATGSGLLAADEETAGLDYGRYEASVRLAGELASLPRAPDGNQGPPGARAGLGFPAGPAAARPDGKPARPGPKPPPATGGAGRVPGP